MASIFFNELKVESKPNPLMQAILEGNLGEVKTYLDLHPLPSNHLYLKMAVTLNHEDIVAYLLEKGADATSLHNLHMRICYATGNVNIMDMLIAHGAEITYHELYKIFNHQPMVDYLIDKQFDFNNRQLLLDLAQRADIDSIKQLIRLGCDIVQEEFLQAVCDKVAFVVLLLDHGIDKNLLQQYANQEVLAYLLEQILPEQPIEKKKHKL